MIVLLGIIVVAAIIAGIGLGKAIGIIFVIGAIGYFLSALRQHAWLEVIIAFCLIAAFMKMFH